MNYLGTTPELIKPISRVHDELKKPFLSFLLNDEYRLLPRVKRNGIQTFVHPTREEVRVNFEGVLNTSGCKRYHIFLKMYLKLGKPFLEKLEQDLDQRFNNAA